MSVLESRLRERYAVSDARVESSLLRVRARIRRRSILRGAAAVLLMLGGGAALLARPAAPEPPESVLVFASTGSRREAFYAPPVLGQLRRESDAAVAVRVLDVAEERVSVRVDEVLFGPPGLSVETVPEHSRRIHSCVRGLEWEEGERCVLFLWRDPETGAFEVRYGGGGRIDLPRAGIFHATAVREMVRSGTLPVPLLVELVERHGPRAVSLARGELRGHPDERLPAGAAPVQDAAARWVLARGGREQVAAALSVLEPERLRALPERVRETLREIANRPENLYTRLERLLPLVRAGVPGALGDLATWRRRADAVVPRPTDNPTWTRALARALAARALHEPEEALPALREICRERKLAGRFDRGDALELLLDVDPAWAARELLEYTEEATAAGYAPRVDLLARLPGPAATAALRKAVLSPTLGAGHLTNAARLREVFLGPGGAGRLAECAPAVARRLERIRERPRHLAVWVELLAASEVGIGPALPQVRDRLREPEGDVEDRAALVRSVQSALGERWLIWLDPTEEELARAERAALAALR